MSRSFRLPKESNLVLIAAFTSLWVACALGSAHVPQAHDNPTAEPHPQWYSYSTNANLTQFQFQVILPPFNVSEYKTYEETIGKLFAGYAVANRSLGELTIKDKSSTVANMSYWHFPKEAHIFGSRETLVKATYTYYGDGAGTSKLVTKIRDLPDYSSSAPYSWPAAYQKFDNEIHCRYYANSRSIEMKDLPVETFPVVTVGDLTVYYGPTFPTYLGVPSSLTLHKMPPRVVVSTNWKLEFKVRDSTGAKSHLKATATLSQEISQDDATAPTSCELDLKIDRDHANGDELFLENGLVAMKDLSQFLAESSIGTVSCVCIAPDGELGCITAPPEPRK